MKINYHLLNLSTAVSNTLFNKSLCVQDCKGKQQFGYYNTSTFALTDTDMVLKQNGNAIASSAPVAITAMACPVERRGQMDVNW
jgi:hypothetical protein